MALTIGSAKLRGNGQPFQLWEVQVVLDGTATSASALAHGIPSPTSAPDAIIRLDGGTASASSMAVNAVSALAASALTHFTVVLQGAGGASGNTFNLGFLYFSQF